MERHARAGLEAEPERPRRLDAVEIDRRVANHHAEIAGLADCGGERLENGVTRRLRHCCRDDVDGEAEEPRSGHVGATVRLALDEALAFELPDDAVHRRLRHGEEDGELGNAERAARIGERLEHGEDLERRRARARRGDGRCNAPLRKLAPRPTRCCPIESGLHD
jgi:hypothetical protein